MSTTDRKLRVFLCHSSQDKPIVREIYQRLNAEGWIDPWLDEEKLLPGQDWDLEIEDAVKAADAVIVCLSSISVKKEGYIQKELRFALNVALEKPENTIFIIPLRLDECFIPRSIKTIQCIDYFPNNKINSAYQKLIKSLKFRADSFRIEKKVSKFDKEERIPSPRKQNQPATSYSSIRKGIVTLLVLLVFGGLATVILFSINFNNLFYNSEPANEPGLIDPTITFITNLPTTIILSATASPITTSTSIAPPTPTAIASITPFLRNEKIITRSNINNLQILYKSDVEFDTLDVAFSPDGNQVAIGGTGSSTYKAKIWKFKDNNIQELPVGFYPVAFSPKGDYLAVARGSGTENLIARIFSIPDLSESAQLHGAQAYITQIKFFPDGKKIAAGSLDNKIIIWDSLSGSALNEIIFDGQVDDFDIDSKSKYIAVSGYLSKQKIYLVDVESGSFINNFIGEQGTVTTVEFSPNGDLIAAGDGINTENFNIYLWRTEDGLPVYTLRGHNLGVNDLAFSPDGQILVSSDFDGISFWDVTTGEFISSMDISAISAITFDPNGYFIGIARSFPEKGVLLLGVP